MVELMVPRDSAVAQRLEGFYQDIGWSVYNSSSDEFFTYVSPHIDDRIMPVVGYWQTENETKTVLFEDNEQSAPSEYAKGLRLPNLQELVEVCLVVPSDKDVQTIYQKGGETIRAHTHIEPHIHDGAQEFRFSDPFNYSLRVTTNPGWELTRLEDRVQVTTEQEYDALQIITAEDLRHFSIKQKGKAAFGNHVYGTIIRKNGRHNILSRYLVFDDDRLPIGIRTEMVPELIERIQSHDIVVRNFSEPSLTFLLDFYEEHFVTEDE